MTVSVDGAYILPSDSPDGTDVTMAPLASDTDDGGDPTANAVSTVNPLGTDAETASAIAGDLFPAANVVLEYRDTSGPLCLDANIQLDSPRPTHIFYGGRAFVQAGVASDGRWIYATV